MKKLHLKPAPASAASASAGGKFNATGAASSAAMAAARRAARALPLDALRGFEAAARLLSFTQAAGELSITQSAISRQIKTLEGAIGVPLFTRFNRRLALTDAGEKLYRSAARALTDINATVDALRGPQARVVTVTTSLSFASLWLVPRLSAFRALHPEIDVRIAANNSIVSLERERIDCAIRFCEPDAAPREAVALMKEETFPVISPVLLKDKAHPLITPADLSGHVLLRFEDSRQPALDWANWLALWDVAALKPAGSVTFSHYDQAISAAVEGEGVAIGRTPHVTHLMKQGKLVPLFAQRAGNRMAVPRQYFMVVARGSRHRPEVQAFADWVLEEVKRD